MGLIQKVMPTRQAAQDKKYKLIADLDEIVAEVYVLKILGNEYELTPVTGNQLRDLENAYSEVKLINQRLMIGDNVPLDAMLNGYYDFCHLVIPSLKLNDLYKMTTKQVNELLKICFKHATSQDLQVQQTVLPESEGPESDEKKNLMK